MALTFYTPSNNPYIQEISDIILSSSLKAQKHNVNTVTAARKLVPSIINEINDRDKEEIFGLFSSNNIKDSNEEFLQYLNSFMLYLRGFIEEPEMINADVEFDGLNRIAAPPKEAYISTGNNKMDVKETKSGYALLADY